MADNFDNVANSKYLLLTTFTKDGRPKPTPVWGVADGDSWLNGWPVPGRTSYPLLFDRQLKPKPAYERVTALVRARSVVP